MWTATPTFRCDDQRAACTLHSLCCHQQSFLQAHVIIEQWPWVQWWSSANSCAFDVRQVWCSLHDMVAGNGALSVRPHKNANGGEAAQVLLEVPAGTAVSVYIQHSL